MACVKLDGLHQPTAPDLAFAEEMRGDETRSSKMKGGDGCAFVALKRAGEKRQRTAGASTVPFAHTYIHNGILSTVPKLFKAGPQLSSPRCSVFHQTLVVNDVNRGACCGTRHSVGGVGTADAAGRLGEAGADKMTILRRGLGARGSGGGETDRKKDALANVQACLERRDERRDQQGESRWPVPWR
jgi:hypothetical protein